MNNPSSSEKKRRNSFPTTPDQAIIRFASSSSDSNDDYFSSSSSKYNASIAINSAKKQKNTIGVFTVPYGSENLDYHATHSAASVPGIIRLKEEGKAPNMYWNIFAGSSKTARLATVYSGAAQGVMEENLHPSDHLEGPKFKSVKAHDDYVADQLCTHIAHGLLGHMIQHNYRNKNFSFNADKQKYINLDDYQSPTVLQLSNYMTDLYFKIGDAKQVAPRKKEIENLIQKIDAAHGKHRRTLLQRLGLQKYDKNAVEQEAQNFLKDFNKKIVTRILESAKDKGLLPAEMEGATEKIQDSVAAVMQPGKFLFNRQGLNAFRVAASWTDSSQLRQRAQEAIQRLNNQKMQEENTEKQAQIQQQINQIKSVSQEIFTTELRYRVSQFLYMSVLAIPALFSVAVNRTGFLEKLPFSLSTNFPLHKEALKLNLISLIDGASVGGCQSAKDRFGSLLCFARAQEDYIATYGVAPPAYGLLGFIPGFMNVIGKGLSFVFAPLSPLVAPLRPVAALLRPLSALIDNYSPERQIFFKDRFAEHWISGAIQYIADANAAGALGIKNNAQIIPAGYRNVIEQKIEEKIKSCYDNLVQGLAKLTTEEEITASLKENEHLKELQLLTLLLPRVSEQLAKINEAVKKTPEEAEKLHQKIITKSEEYIMPILENIFKMGGNHTELSPEKRVFLESYIKKSIKKANQEPTFVMESIYGDDSTHSFTESNPSWSPAAETSERTHIQPKPMDPPRGVFVKEQGARETKGSTKKKEGKEPG